jgi:uncharacterized protein (TIGR03067 family)
MSKRWATVILLLLLMASAPAAQDRTPLEGAWQVVSTAFDGQLHQSENQVILTFKGTTYTQAVDGSINERGIVRLDQTSKPMRIDFVLSEPSLTQLGVVAIEGETMRLHVNRGGAVRPTDFNPLPDNFFIVARKLTSVAQINSRSTAINAQSRRFWRPWRSATVNERNCAKH